MRKARANYDIKCRAVPSDFGGKIARQFHADADFVDHGGPTLSWPYVPTRRETSEAAKP
jgi:hypothetical protein